MEFYVASFVPDRTDMVDQHYLVFADDSEDAWTIAENTFIGHEYELRSVRAIGSLNSLCMFGRLKLRIER